MSAPVQSVVHTPGPWEAMCDEARGKPRCLIVDKDGNEIAAVNSYREAWNANADLIAAAPELLAAIKDFLGNACRPNDDGKYDDMFDNSRKRLWQIIRKTEGCEVV